MGQPRRLLGNVDEAILDGRLRMQANGLVAFWNIPRHGIHSVGDEVLDQLVPDAWSSIRTTLALRFCNCARTARSRFG